MTPRTLADLRGLLFAEGLDAGDPESWRAQLEEGSATPWFVRLLVGFGAWTAGLMLAVGLGAILALGRSGAALLIVGLALCAGGAALRQASKGDFSAQFALSMSLAGQAMAGVGLVLLSDRGDRWNLFFAAMTALEVGLLLLFRDTVHRYLSAFAGALLFTLLLEHLRFAWLESAFLGLALLAWGLLPATVWRGPLRALRRPLGYALATVFLGLFLWHSLERMLFHHSSGPALWAAGFRDLPVWVLGALAPGLLLGAAALRILLRLGQPLASAPALLVLAAVLGLSLLGLRVPGVAAVLFVLVLAAEAREPALFGLGVVAGLVLLARLYYDLDLSLLGKSAALAGSGGLLLLLRVLLGAGGRP